MPNVRPIETVRFNNIFQTDDKETDEMILEK